MDAVHSSSPTIPPDATPAERAFLAAIDSGNDRVIVGPVFPGDPGSRGESSRSEICAGILDRLFTPTDRVRAGDRVVEIRGAVIRDRLSWSFARRIPPLEFVDCDFHDTVDLHSAHVSHLAFRQSCLRHLDLSGATVLESVVLGEGTTVKGGISIKNAVIRGDFVCTGLKLHSTLDEPALLADGVRVGGSVFLDRGFVCRGGVQMCGAAVQGHLELSGGRFFSRIAPGASPPLSFRRAAREGAAFVGDLSRVEGNVRMEGGFHAQGGVSFQGTQVRGSILATSAKCAYRQGCALCLDGAATQGDVALDQALLVGKTRMLGARIGGDLDCTRSTFVNPRGGVAISAARLSVKSNLYLNDGFQSQGEIRLAGAHVGGTVLCNNACLRYNWLTPPEADPEERCVLNAERLGVDGDISIENTVVDGSVNLRSAIIRRDLSIRHVYFTEEPNGLIADGARVQGELGWAAVSCNPATRVRLSHASVGRVVHDVVSWPGEGCLHLRGLTYRDIQLDAGNKVRHVEWLRRLSPFDPQPYEQLGQALRRSGDEEEAVAISIAKHDARRRDKRLGWRARSKAIVLGSTIRYGYGVQRMVLLGVLMWLLGAWMFEIGRDNGVLVPTREAAPPGAAHGYPPFNSAVYSLDALLPVVDLHQEEYWFPSADASCRVQAPAMQVGSCGSALRVYLWLHILVGWTISTLVVVGLTGLVRHE